MNILTEFTFFLREHSCLAHSLSRCCSRAPLKNTANSILLLWTVCMSTAKNCTIRFHCPPHTQSVKERNYLCPGMDSNCNFSVIKHRNTSLSLIKITVTIYIWKTSPKMLWHHQMGILPVWIMQDSEGWMHVCILTNYLYFLMTIFFYTTESTSLFIACIVLC